MRNIRETKNSLHLMQLAENDPRYLKDEQLVFILEEPLGRNFLYALRDIHWMITAKNLPKLAGEGKDSDELTDFQEEQYEWCCTFIDELFKAVPFLYGALRTIHPYYILELPDAILNYMEIGLGETKENIEIYRFKVLILNFMAYVYLQDEETDGKRLPTDFKISSAQQQAERKRFQAYLIKFCQEEYGQAANINVSFMKVQERIQEFLQSLLTQNQQLAWADEDLVDAIKIIQKEICDAPLEKRALPQISYIPVCQQGFPALFASSVPASPDLLAAQVSEEASQESDQEETKPLLGHLRSGAASK